jgi:hypothetical protein
LSGVCRNANEIGGSGVPLPPVDSLLRTTNPGGRRFGSCWARQCFQLLSDTARLAPPRFVNDREQFAAHGLHRRADRSIEHLRVHVQRGVDARVAHQLSHDFPRHALLV